MSDIINVEVAYATPDLQKIVAIEVAIGTTAREAVKASGIEQFFPSLSLENANLGIFGNALGARGLAKAEEYVLREGDRVEICRPLIADPKEVRKRRAAEAAARRAEEKAS